MKPKIWAMILHFESMSAFFSPKGCLVLLCMTESFSNSDTYGNFVCLNPPSASITVIVIMAGISL